MYYGNDIYYVGCNFDKNIKFIPKHNTEDKRDEMILILKIVYKMVKIQPAIFATHSSILLHNNLLVLVNVFIIVY